MSNEFGRRIGRDRRAQGAVPDRDDHPEAPNGGGGLGTRPTSSPSSTPEPASQAVSSQAVDDSCAARRSGEHDECRGNAPDSDGHGAIDEHGLRRPPEPTGLLVPHQATFALLTTLR
uniref:hypothetical protein n=1 Tax=Streptomyces sp. HYC2 TaxID=2955207 RepID=UPI0024809E2E